MTDSDSRENIMTYGVVRFRAIESSDLPSLRDWRNEAIVHHRQWRPLSMLDQEAWLRRVTEGHEHIMLAICDWGHPETLPGQPIVYPLAGVGGLTYVDWVRRRAELSIYIGGVANQRRGLGTAALRGLCAYGFGHLALHRLYAEIYAYNDVSIRLFEKVGFKLEGRMREHMFYRGEWHDSLLYGLLAREWREAREAQP